MKDICKIEEFTIPDNVTVEVKSRIVTVTGKRGKLTKNLRHIDLEIQIKNKKIKLIVWHGTRKHVACLRTVKAHIENMITGVTKVRLNKKKIYICIYSFK